MMRAIAIAALLLAACGKVESGGDVTLTLEPPSVFFRRGETAMVQVTAADAVNTIAVTAAGLPPGVTADPLALDGPAPGMLALHADATATEGLASVTLTADVGGSTDLRVLVGGPPGTLDESFADGGKLVPQLSALSLASRGMVFTDAGAVVTGFVQSSPPQAITLRVREDGTLDPGFGDAGFVSTGAGAGIAEGIAVTNLPDGHVIVAGISGGSGAADSDFGLYGYTAAGDLDASFGASGVASLDPGSGFGELHSVLVAPDGSLLVAGALFPADGSAPTTRALRYSAGGMQDTAYNVTEPGIAVEGAAVQPDGKLVIVGGQSSSFFVARYGANGARDTGFGSGGVVTTAFGSAFANANGVVVLPGGKLLVAGIVTLSTESHIGVARYNANGSLDVTFGSGGKIEPPMLFGSVSPTGVIASGDKLLFVGEVANVPAVVRLNADGSPDAAFGTGGVVTVDFGVTGSSNRTQAFGVAVDPDGRILISAELGPSGSESLGIARLWP